ncbi:hypothetical protein BT96DRAFT_982370 [Gymnopus androsaceus JB14]|uniref:Uncharacterized protein n=1 Tax=Gymnopus androsaceus JB14 TaxID=1447944 RepID=A0A6A4GFK6_9AGAR|nr:hypothetical protein BT96DRAFT_982370 [Gymnopus androsaceus JB14]
MMLDISHTMKALWMVRIILSSPRSNTGRKRWNIQFRLKSASSSNRGLSCQITLLQATWKVARNKAWLRFLTSYVKNGSGMARLLFFVLFGRGFSVIFLIFHRAFNTISEDSGRARSSFGLPRFSDGIYCERCIPWTVFNAVSAFYVGAKFVEAARVALIQCWDGSIDPGIIEDDNGSITFKLIVGIRRDVVGNEYRISLRNTSEDDQGQYPRVYRTFEKNAQELSYRYSTNFAAERREVNRADLDGDLILQKQHRGK